MQTDSLINIVDTVASTSTALKQLAASRQLPHLYTLCTWHQTAGRGQQGNSWESEPDKNISFSTILDASSIPQQRLRYVSEVCALAVAGTLRSYCIDAEVKWPNDIYVGDKKICGILIETVLQGGSVRCCIAGIGINVNQTVFVSDAPNPVSMRLITGLVYDKEQVLRRTLASLADMWGLMLTDPDALHQHYLNLLYRRSGLWLWRRREPQAAPMRIMQQHSADAFRACIAGIDEQGRLILRHENGRTEAFGFKEIQYIIEK